MGYEWDPIKNRANLSKHGISFEEASEILNSDTFTAEDKRTNYGETRFISIGILSNLVALVVVHTERNELVRIISARKANQKELKLYYDYLKEKT